MTVSTHSGSKGLRNKRWIKVPWAKMAFFLPYLFDLPYSQNTTGNQPLAEVNWTFKVEL